LKYNVGARPRAPDSSPGPVFAPTESKVGPCAMAAALIRDQ
jgi:hypothetical protein